MSEKIYRDYFEDKEDFDYKNLKIPEGVEAQPLTVPPVLIRKLLLMFGSH